MLDTPSKKRIPSDSMCINTSVIDTSILKTKAKKPDQTPSAELAKIKELEERFVYCYKREPTKTSSYISEKKK